MDARFATAFVGLLASLIVSVALWRQFGALVLFVFLPFVPLLFGRDDGERPGVRRCSDCGFRTRDPDYDYCPRDGTPLAVNE